MIQQQQTVAHPLPSLLRSTFFLGTLWRHVALAFMHGRFLISWLPNLLLAELRSALAGISFQNLSSARDAYSDVYVLVTLRGGVFDADVTAYVRDGGKYAWYIDVFQMSTGLYDVYVTAPSGVAVGSYPVEVRASWENEEEYYGTATYVIDCWATVT